MRARRHFSDEYKAEVVHLIVVEKRGIGKVCKEMDLTESSVRRWVSEAEVERSSDGIGALKKEERDELKQLRREVRQLRMEREILKNRFTRRAEPCLDRNTLRRDTAPDARTAAVRFLVTHLIPIKNVVQGELRT